MPAGIDPALARKRSWRIIRFGRILGCNNRSLGRPRPMNVGRPPTAPARRPLRMRPSWRSPDGDIHPRPPGVRHRRRQPRLCIPICRKQLGASTWRRLASPIGNRGKKAPGVPERPAAGLRGRDAWTARRAVHPAAIWRSWQRTASGSEQCRSGDFEPADQRAGRDRNPLTCRMRSATRRMSGKRRTGPRRTGLPAEGDPSSCLMKTPSPPVKENRTARRTIRDFAQVFLLSRTE